MKRTVLITMIFMAALIGSLSMSGCYYDVEEELYGGNVCDTANVSYSSTITGLLTSYGCLGCHSGATPSGNVSLANHAGVSTNINRVWGAINHMNGFHPMPQGGNKMNACDIRKIGAWKDAGAPNN